MFRRSSPEAAGSTVNVQVPVDWVEGQPLTLQLSDGRQIVVEVPPGVCAGDSFECTLPTANGK